MEGMELINFQIIAAVGTAKSKFIEAYEIAKTGDFDLADCMMKEGEEYLLKGQTTHMQLVSKEASGEKVEVQLLLVHAEDQFMSAETLKYVIQEMIELRKDMKQ